MQVYEMVGIFGVAYQHEVLSKSVWGILIFCIKDLGTLESKTKLFSGHYSCWPTFPALYFLPAFVFITFVPRRAV